MQIFELQFNPKLKDDRYFASLAFEPENSYEKSLGNLYFIGELEKATPDNANLLEKICKDIKKKYYGASFKKSNKALAESLKSGNDLLSEEIKKENVSWLGNLNFSVLAIKDLELSFTATGSLKLLLLRAGQINDISKDLNNTEIEPYPLKVFFNVVSGKLLEDDLILAVSKDLYDFLSEKKIIEKLADSGPLSEKKLKEIAPQKTIEEADEAGISGVFTIIDFSKKQSAKAKEIIFKKPNESFFNKLKEFKFFKKPKEEIRIPIKTAKKRARISFPQTPDSKKNAVIIACLLIILIFGFALFKRSEGIRQNKETESFNLLLEKFKEAETAIAYGEEKKADNLLREILQSVSKFIEEGSAKKAEADKLKSSAEERLYAIYKIKRVENPEVLADIDFKNLEFVPQTLLISGYQMYLSSTISSNLFVFDLNKRKGEVYKYGQNLELSDDSSSIILFFSRPSQVISFSSQKFKEEKIELSESKFSFDLMSTYASNLYFLDQEKNEIIKYSYNNNFRWASPKLSFKPKEKVKSMALDSYFWMLNENNKIAVYYKGEYQRTVDVNIFPEIKNITKIKTKAGLPYLYLLEPANNRLIITDKNGKIIEQIQSEKFDNLKDFSISYNGSTIWILNGEQIFRVEM